MTKAKGSYSLISVDVAPDEEVVRVDAQGVHRESAGGKGASDGDHPIAVAEAAASEMSEQKGKGAAERAEHADLLTAREKKEAAEAASQKKAEADSYDGRGDLEGPVPMAGMQRAIIAVVVLCLVAFAVYFAVSHG